MALARVPCGDRSQQLLTSIVIDSHIICSDAIIDVFRLVSPTWTDAVSMTHSSIFEQWDN